MSPSPSVTVIVSVAVSVVPDAASVTAPVSSESAIEGALLVISNCYGCCMDYGYVSSSPEFAVPPLSFHRSDCDYSVVGTVGEVSVFL